MKTAMISERMAARIIAAPLILTALGNARVMVLAAFLGVGVGLQVFRHSVTWRSIGIRVITASFLRS